MATKSYKEITMTVQGFKNIDRFNTAGATLSDTILNIEHYDWLVQLFQQAPSNDTQNSRIPTFFG